MKFSFIWLIRLSKFKTFIDINKKKCNFLIYTLRSVVNRFIASYACCLVLERIRSRPPPSKRSVGNHRNQQPIVAANDHENNEKPNAASIAFKEKY